MCGSLQLVVLLLYVLNPQNSHDNVVIALSVLSGSRERSSAPGQQVPQLFLQITFLVRSLI